MLPGKQLDDATTAAVGSTVNDVDAKEDAAMCEAKTWCTVIVRISFDVLSIDYGV